MKQERKKNMKERRRCGLGYRIYEVRKKKYENLRLQVNERVITSQTTVTTITTNSISMTLYLLFIIIKISSEKKKGRCGCGWKKNCKHIVKQFSFPRTYE